MNKNVSNNNVFQKRNTQTNSFEVLRTLEPVKQNTKNTEKNNLEDFPMLVKLDSPKANNGVWSQKKNPLVYNK